MTDQALTTEHTLTFGETEITAVEYNGRTWLTAEQVGVALGVGDPRNSINRLYQRNAEEFEEGYDSVADKLSATDGKSYETRVFSKTGCILLAFFSKSKKAAAFRKWAKEVLADHSDTPPATERRRISSTMEPVVRTVAWDEVGFFVVDHRGQTGITAGQIVVALGRGEQGPKVGRMISSLYCRYKEHFTQEVHWRKMTFVQPGDELRRPFRVFSLCGLRLILSLRPLLETSPNCERLLELLTDFTVRQDGSQTARSAAVPEREQQLLEVLRPDLSKMVRYHAIGLNSCEIGQLMSMEVNDIDLSLSQLNDVALLPGAGSLLR